MYLEEIKSQENSKHLKNKSDYYKEKYVQGKSYEDFIYNWLEKNKGLKITPSIYNSEHYNIGENKIGIEIKYDMKMKETGNIYIETSEKTSNGLWIPSGIFAKNPIILIIGDYETIYILNAHFLRNYILPPDDDLNTQILVQVAHTLEPVKKVSNKTSKGFLLKQNGPIISFCGTKYNVIM